MVYKLLVLFCCSLVIGCSNSRTLSSKIIKPVLEKRVISEIQKEIDDIHILLTYSLVYADWQADSVPRNKRRGYNIGALLVNDQNLPVFYGLNCINSTNNATQHGEVRTIMGFLEKNRSFSLTGFSMYTTLEPCIMCAGMMTMTSIKRVVYGQNDVDYSKAFERLAVDTRSIGGFAPYPRSVVAQQSDILFRQQLDDHYQSFLLTSEEKILAKFLTSPQAQSIYHAAQATFLQYKPKHPENEQIYKAAINFYSLNTKLDKNGK